MTAFLRRSGLVALALVPALALASLAEAGDGCAMLGVPGSVASDDSGRAPACAAAPAQAAAVAAAAASDAAQADVITRGALANLDGLLAQVTPPAPPASPTPRSAPAPAPRATRSYREYRIDRETRKGHSSTDTTVVVRRGTRLDLNNFGGAIAIATWPKDAVRIRAEHSRADWIDVKNLRGVLHVQSTSRLGPSQAIEYRITLPAWMPIQLSGVYNDVTADGVEGGISVETVRGDIVVRRASGNIELRSVEGIVDLSEASGTIMVSSVNDAVRLMKVAGAIQAEAVNGDIQLIELSSRDVEASTINGAVLFDGKMFDGGSYRFSTHSGDIAMGMNARSNATVTVSTYAGDFEAPFPIRLSRKDKGKRFEFVLGTGKADVELESFQGAIQLFAPGDKAMLKRFAETWRESVRERKDGFQWIMKGESVHEHDLDDEEDEEAPTPPPKRGK